MSSARISGRKRVCASLRRALDMAVVDACASRSFERSRERSRTARKSTRSCGSPLRHGRSDERSQQRGKPSLRRVCTTGAPSARHSVRRGRSRIALALGVILSYTPPQGTPGGSDPGGVGAMSAFSSGRIHRSHRSPDPPLISCAHTSALFPCAYVRPVLPFSPRSITTGRPPLPHRTRATLG